jgi:hypothetical protein
MKRIVRSLLAFPIAWTLLALSLLSLRTVMAINQQVPSSPPLPAASTFYRMLDDFNTGGSRPCDADNEGKVSSPCLIVDSSYAVMTYNVTSASAFAWLPILITHSGSSDLTGWGWVWVVIRGQTGGEQIYAEFARDSSNEYPKVKISDYLVGGITTTWRAAAIPLDAFGLSDWSGIDRFSLVAQNAISSGVGEIHVDEVRLLPPVVTMDDYHDQEFENELGGDSGVWSSSPSTFMTPTFVAGNLKLSYDVPPTGSSSYWTSLRTTNLLSHMKNLVFEVRGEQGREKVLAEFADCGINGYDHHPKIMIGDYLEDGIATEWRTVAMPLVAFTDVQTDADPGIDWSCLDSFNFFVGGDEPYDSGQGIIYVDNPRLVPYRTVPVVVDRFRDCNKWNALNGQWFTGTNGVLTATFDMGANHSGSYGCGYHLTHAVALNEGAWVWTELRGLDVSGYDYLDFYIRGKRGDEYVKVKLEDWGSESPSFGIGISVSTDWQLKKLPLSEFQAHSVDLTDLKTLLFTFEGGVRIGEVDIDDISFIKLSQAYLPVIQKTPLTNLYLHNYTGGDVAYTVHGIGSKTVPDTSGGTRFFWGSFPVGEYSFSWYKISKPSCRNSGHRTWPEGDFEPPPMVCY